MEREADVYSTNKELFKKRRYPENQRDCNDTSKMQQFCHLIHNQSDDSDEPEQ